MICQLDEREMMESRDIQTPHGVMRVTVTPESESIENIRQWGDWVSDADVSAWFRDEWQFVNVRVDHMHRCATCTVMHHTGDSASLGMVIMGRGDGWAVTMNDLIGTHPVPDLIAEIVAASQKGK